MEKATQQRIMAGLNQTLSDLSDWLRSEGWSEAELSPILSAVMLENGMFAAAILDKSSKALTLNGTVKMQAGQVGQALSQVASGEFADSLLRETEPNPDELRELLEMMRTALPNLRQHLFNSAKHGPRHRRGGRPKEIDDPEERERIREAIKSLRDPEVRVQDLDQRFAAKYGVSPTAIKRIRLEKKKDPTLPQK